MEVIVTFVVVALIALALLRRRYVKRHSGQSGEAGRWVTSEDHRQYDFNSQLAAITDGAYQARRLMNGEEARVLYKIEAWLRQRDRGERVFAQVPLGAYLQAEDDDHRIIRHKRPDFLVVDRSGMPVFVVEYQGGGHFQGDALQSDLLKKAVLAKAQIPLVEVFSFEKDDEQAVFAKLNGAAASRPTEVA